MATANDNLELDLKGLEQLTEAVLTGGYTLKDFTEISDDEADAAYAVAYNLFNQGQYHKAEKLFEFLCQLDHYEGRFWIGLGSCRQMLKHYESAVKAYSMAGIHDMENPVPALRAAECYLALGQLEEAESGASAALLWASDKAEHQALKARAEVIMNSIVRRKGS